LQTVMPPDATAETIAIVKHAYGFDKPLPVQFLIWLGRVVTGDTVARPRTPFQAAPPCRGGHGSRSPAQATGPATPIVANPANRAPEPS